MSNAQISARPVKLLPEDSSRGRDFLTFVKLLAACEGDHAAALAMAESLGTSSERVRRVLKSPVGIGHTGDSSFGSVLADWRFMVAGFFDFLASRSLFFSLLENGFTRVPFRVPIGVVGAGATATLTGEGAAVPMSVLELSKPTLEPFTIAAIVALSKEIALDQSAAAQGLISRSLRTAVAEEVDGEFLAAITDSLTPTFASTGNDAASMHIDLLELLDAVNTRAGGELVWVMGPEVANRASLISDPRSAMTPQGGFLLGLRAFVSAGIEAGSLALINASAIAANADPEGFEFDVSRQTSLELDTAPTHNAATPAGASLVSLWQTNAVALRCRVRIAAERLRDDAVAVLTDINWMESTSV